MKRIAVLLLTCLMSTWVSAAALPDFPFVVSDGKAEKKITPDIATIHLTITAFHKDSDQALKTVNLTTTAVTEVLIKHGVSTEQIEATDINKSTARKRDSEYNQLEILGYDISRSMTIKLNNLAKYSEIIGDIIATNNVSGVQAQFDLSTRTELESELTLLAGQNAREKAEQMARALGTKIHSVYAITRGAGFEELFGSYGPGEKVMMMRMAAGGGAYDTIMFPPREITVSQEIKVIFRIK